MWTYLVIAVAALTLGCASDDGDGGSCGDGVCRGETNATCPDDCPANGPFCGDGTCNGTETATTCADDCGTTACSTSPDNCNGETICIAGTCEAAFPRVYAITSVTVSVPTTNPNDGGNPWDVGGGAPDLYLADMTCTGFTVAVQDQFSASFAGPFDVQLVAGTTLRIDVCDEDTIDPPDGAFACQEAPITAARLRTRQFGCVGNGFSMTSTITPK